MASAGIGDRVEGLHAVAAALGAGRVQSIIVELQRLDHPAYAGLAEAAERDSTAVEVVDDVRPLARTDAPQGVIARCRPIEPVSLADAVAASDPAAVLVFDHLEDSRNLGAAVRSAVAAGFGAIIVSKRRSAPLGATAFKAAAGAFEKIAIAEVGSIPEALQQLNRLGLWRVGLDAAGERSLFGLAVLADPVAIVVGAEGSGLARLTAERCDAVVSIPQLGEIESLNASVATALAVFEVARVRGWVS